ncbi:MAG: hypothetical protein H6622_18145 [Halobacteriovoraceae bacterium]|nr:hypothetical protein [Halobacteriovoraceae bacterium]
MKLLIILSILVGGMNLYAFGRNEYSCLSCELRTRVPFVDDDPEGLKGIQQLLGLPFDKISGQNLSKDELEYWRLKNKYIEEKRFFLGKVRDLMMQNLKELQGLSKQDITAYCGDVTPPRKLKKDILNAKSQCSDKAGKYLIFKYKIKVNGKLEEKHVEIKHEDYIKDYLKGLKKLEDKINSKLTSLQSKFKSNKTKKELYTEETIIMDLMSNMLDKNLSYLSVSSLRTISNKMGKEVRHGYRLMNNPQPATFLLGLETLGKYVSPNEPEFAWRKARGITGYTSGKSDANPDGLPKCPENEIYGKKDGKMFCYFEEVRLPEDKQNQKKGRTMLIYNYENNGSYQSSVDLTDYDARSGHRFIPKAELRGKVYLYSILSYDYKRGVEGLKKEYSKSPDSDYKSVILKNNFFNGVPGFEFFEIN